MVLRDLKAYCRDAFLGPMKTRAKLGIPFWDYLGDRLRVPDAPNVPFLPHSVGQPAAPPRPPGLSPVSPAWTLTH